MLIFMTFATMMLLLLLWLGIQRAWQRSFPEAMNEDALAGQFRCGSCGCGDACERQDEGQVRWRREA